MSGVSRALVESAVHSLNDKAEQLGMSRRFEFHPGSKAMGRQHTLVETQPTLAHPVSQTKIGITLKDALEYVTAMNHGLLTALQDRSHKRSQTVTGSTFVDPDARSATRGDRG